MLDIRECAASEIQKHPVSRNQYPGLRNIASDFHYNGLSPRKHSGRFFQSKFTDGKFKPKNILKKIDT